MSNKLLNTELQEAEAGLLVLGHSLTHGVAAYKTYTNVAGYVSGN